ncbi:ABC transporter ATP-binding protein [Leptolyngbya ohadii]|uniref:ABC transporter ATP-binding protein n=1 Tax=Leptolyngbya ohadii TaxID=1962290 RepID=UPI000B59A1FF|nr:polysaccharide ABC transporter ATP-binding protein [Leptolyngbya ohadii]
MTDIVVQVESLSKRYILGQQSQPSTLRSALSEGMQSLQQRLRGRSPRRQSAPAEEFWALQDVSFTVNQGDRVGIIGRNGAGKSTLLKILSRITEPTCGQVRLRGRVASLLEVGTGFHPELTGRENIFLNGAILGMSKAEIQRKFDEIVAFAEVERFLDTPVKRYSSGMYVRLAFAVAAHLEPEILIVDEVLAVGDVQFQKKCLGKMGQVATEGRTVFFVSHNLGAISALCDKAIFLERGQLRSIGATDRLVKMYLSDALQNQEENLSNLRLRGYGEKIQFLDIKLLAEDGIQVFGEPIQYELTLRSAIDMDGLSIGSSFFNQGGTCIGSLLSDEFSVRRNEVLKLRLTVSSLNLAPDSYYAGFSIGFGHKEGTRKDLDIVIGKPAFEIVPKVNSDYHLTNWNSNWGSVAFRDVKLTVHRTEKSLLS